MSKIGERLVRPTSEKLALEGHGVKGIGDLVIVGFNLG